MVPATLFMLAVRLAPGPSTVSTTVGMMQQASSLGQFIAPPVVAWIAHRAAAGNGPGSSPLACSLAGMALAARVAPAQVPATRHDMNDRCDNFGRRRPKADTRRWLERAVIGLNLCPFAKAVHVRGQIHYAVYLPGDEARPDRRAAARGERARSPRRRPSATPHS